MKTVAFLTPEDAYPGFGLAGLRHYSVQPEDTEAVLAGVMARPEVGLIVLDERLTSRVPDSRIKEIEGGWHGILLVLPSPVKGPPEEEDYAARIIRRAIGYHVRIRA